MYRDNLAYVHHKGFGQFVKAAVPGLLGMLRERGIRSGHVVDLGCGDGTWLRALTDGGFAATGIDQSVAFAKLARRTAPKAVIRHASLYRAALPSCDAITAIGEVLNYLPERSGAPPSFRRMFRRAFTALRPGGLLIFDLLVAGRPAIDREAAHVGPDWAVFARVTEDARRARLSRHIVAFRRRGACYTREEEIHWLRLPTRARVLADLRRAGFDPHLAAGYGAVPPGPRSIVFVARR